MLQRPLKRSLSPGMVCASTFASLCPTNREKLVRAAVTLVKGLAPSGSRNDYFRAVIRALERCVEEECPSQVGSLVPERTKIDHLPEQLVVMKKREENPTKKRKVVVPELQNSSTTFTSPKKSTLMCRFDILPPDVVISHIFSHLELSVNAVRRGPRVLESWFFATTDYLEFSYYRRRKGAPNARATFGYFCRDPFRYPWFLFRHLLGELVSPEIVCISLKTVLTLEIAEQPGVTPASVVPKFGMLEKLYLRREETEWTESSNLPKWSHSVNTRHVRTLQYMFLDSHELLDLDWKGSVLEVANSKFPTFQEEAVRTQILSLKAQDCSNVLECPVLPELRRLWIEFEFFDPAPLSLDAWFSRQAFSQLQHLRVMGGIISTPIRRVSFVHLGILELVDSLVSDKLFQHHRFPSLRVLTIQDPLQIFTADRWLLDESTLEKISLTGMQRDQAALVLNRVLRNAVKAKTVVLHNIEFSPLMSWKLPAVSTLFLTSRKDIQRVIRLKNHVVRPECLQLLHLENVEIVGDFGEGLKNLSGLTMSDGGISRDWNCSSLESLWCRRTRLLPGGVPTSFRVDWSKLSCVVVQSKLGGLFWFPAQVISSLFSPCWERLAARILDALRCDVMDSMVWLLVFAVDLLLNNPVVSRCCSPRDESFRELSLEADDEAILLYRPVDVFSRRTDLRRSKFEIKLRDESLWVFERKFDGFSEFRELMNWLRQIRSTLDALKAPASADVFKEMM